MTKEQFKKLKIGDFIYCSSRRSYDKGRTIGSEVTGIDRIIGLINFVCDGGKKSYKSVDLKPRSPASCFVGTSKVVNY